MMIARWSIEARFGYKPQVVEAMKRWADDVGKEVGLDQGKLRLSTGSIGAHESTIQSEFEINDLSELNAAWDRMAKLEKHKQWSKDLEPYVVSGTPRWEVFRVIE